MKVNEVMTQDVKSCTPEMNLAEAAAIMWEADCGALPVMVDGKVAGMITDRDICIALGTRNARASEVTVGEAETREVFSCAPNDDVHQALKTMRTHKVHRLPVVGETGTLDGMLCMNEIILRAHKTARKPADVTYEDVVNTLKGISEHRPAAVLGEVSQPAALAAAV